MFVKKIHVSFVEKNGYLHRTTWKRKQKTISPLTSVEEQTSILVRWMKWQFRGENFLPGGEKISIFCPELQLDKTSTEHFLSAFEGRTKGFFLHRTRKIIKWKLYRRHQQREQGNVGQWISNKKLMWNMQQTKDPLAFGPLTHTHT